MSDSTGRVMAIRRFPVKGLSPEELLSVSTEVGRPLAGDRRLAIENGPSGFDPARPAKIPKTRFLCLMRNARLAALSTRYDEAAGVLSIALASQEVSFDLGSEEGRARLEDWLTGFMGEEARGPLRVLPAPEGHTFSDTALGVLSIINRSSVAAVGEMMGAAVDPLRFRGNLDIDGFDPWQELDWVGRTLKIGEVELRVIQRTVRCAAVEVDPATARRDLAIPATLQKRLGHADCGVYAEVVSPGRLELGAPVELV